MSGGKVFSQVRFAVLQIMILWMFAGEVAVAKKIKVACVGNSVTYGYKIDNPEINSYPAQLQQLLGDAYDVANFGKSGATLLQKGHRPYMEQNEFREAVKFQPDILIVSLGLNDTDPRNWPNYRDEFVADYMTLIDSIKKSDGTQPELWIGRMTPIFHWHPRFKSGTRDWFWQIQQAIEQVAINCQANIIDWHSPLHARPHLFPDALHPTKEGASIMAQVAYQHLTGDYGGLQMAPAFGDHMVLQRNKPIPVWGIANGAEEISVELNGVKSEVITGTDGRWHLVLPAMKHGGSFELKINSTNEEIVFENVMIGEVWLCAGQSNMAFKLNESTFGAEELKKKMPSQLRLMNFKQSAYTNDMAWDKATLDEVNTLNYLSGQWHMLNTETVADFSAIAWYFGSVLEAELDVPVGLIQMAVGGSPTESWIDRKTLEFNPHLVNMLYDWQNNDHSMLWCRKRAMVNIKKSDDPMQRHPYQPAYLFEAGIKLVAGYSIKGVLWYQGESNVHNVELHEILFPNLIHSIRCAWKQPDLPFYFAQLSSLNRPSWTHFRDSQRRMSNQLPNVSMIVTSDLGNETDVHPKQKKQVGERFAYLALHQLYDKDSIPFGNIEIEYVDWSNEQLSIRFSHTDLLKTSDGLAVKELEVAGKNGIFYSVKAMLKENQLIVETKGQCIQAVRYGWQPYSQGNLVNEDGVPVSTFLINRPVTNKLIKEISQ